MVTTPWTVDPSIVSFLVRGDGLDPKLGRAAEWIAVTEAERKACLYPVELAAMETFVQDLRAGQHAPIELEIVGTAGTGKRTLAAQLCARLGRDLIVADAALLKPDIPLSTAIELALRVVRMTRLAGAVLYWHDAGGVDPRVWRVIHASVDLSLFGALAPMSQSESGIVRKSFSLPRLTRAKRASLWHRLTGSPPPGAIADWMLTPAEIAGAAQVVPAGAQAVVDVCRQLLYQAPGELFVPLPCPYNWEDIVLSSAVRTHLMELEQQARLRWPVYEEWGFERLCPLGRGISALFAGPSGTGKTMAAQVLARSLGMDLYRVDLAGVMNKYIGETEKRLRQVFDSCERANVLLLFDEADALFGQRTQVKDAHDRFANIEIDYLLQRMEQFDGIAILATNRKGDLDQAFLRRLRFIVDFMPPGPVERLVLWQHALPRCAPAGEEILGQIDWQLLAEKLTMTGADITSAALGAAFLARSEDTRIGMQHVLAACRREMAKHNVVLRPEEWEG